MKMRPFHNGYTLIELIVSMMLVTIVVMGIVAINISLTTNNVDFGQRYYVRSATQTTLNNILNNAYLAVGDSTTVGSPTQVTNTGFLLPGQYAMPANCFTIHQAANNNITGTTLANDIWLAYCITANQITYFYKWYNLSDPSGARGANAACPANCFDSTFLGTANSMAPSFSLTSGFSITLQNCFDNTAGTCNGGGQGVSSDPANNPEVSLTGTVFPPQESTG